MSPHPASEGNARAFSRKRLAMQPHIRPRPLLFNNLSTDGLHPEHQRVQTSHRRLPCNKQLQDSLLSWLWQDRLREALARIERMRPDHCRSPIFYRFGYQAPPPLSGPTQTPTRTQRCQSHPRWLCTRVDMARYIPWLALWRVVGLRSRDSRMCLNFQMRF